MACSYDYIYETLISKSNNCLSWVLNVSWFSSLWTRNLSSKETILFWNETFLASSTSKYASFSYNYLVLSVYSSCHLTFLFIYSSNLASARNYSLRPPLAELLPATICTCWSSCSTWWLCSFTLFSRVISLSNATSMSFF